MSNKAKEVIHEVTGVLYGYAVRCPACTELNLGSIHVFALKMCNGAPGWVFSGTLESPTFQPSMRATATEGDTGTVHVCHSFVREGKIQYLNDCTHRMAGTTVDLPDFEELTE